MDVIAILIGLLVLAGVAYYVSRPMLRPQVVADDTGVDTLTLEARRDSLYTQIKELDQDHETGKVNDEDYVRLRAELKDQAAQVLREIDGALVTPIAATSSAADEIETLVAARRKTRSAAAPRTKAAPATTDADLEAAIAARRKTSTPVAATTPDAAAAFCPKCGKPVKVDDAFCAKCGAALQPQPSP